jgi:hypothetical protein
MLIIIGLNHDELFHMLISILFVVGGTLFFV